MEAVEIATLLEIQVAGLREWTFQPMTAREVANQMEAFLCTNLNMADADCFVVLFRVQTSGGSGIVQYYRVEQA